MTRFIRNGIIGSCGGMALMLAVAIFITFLLWDSEVFFEIANGTFFRIGALSGFCVSLMYTTIERANHDT